MRGIVCGLLLISLTGCGVVQDQIDLKRAKSEVAAQLMDGPSARWKDVHIIEASSKQGSYIKSMCGELNAKNAMGGYTGFKPFFYVIERRYSPDASARQMQWFTKGELTVGDADAPGTLADIRRVCTPTTNASDYDLNSISLNIQ